MPDLAVVKVLAEYRVTIKLPDTESKRREMSMNKLKELGCTVFGPEVRQYDMANNYETITLRGFIVEPVTQYTEPTGTSPVW